MQKNQNAASRGIVVRGLVAALAAGALVLGGSIAAQAAPAKAQPLQVESVSKGPSSFPDVPTSHPFHEAITWMSQTGVSTGYADGTFRPSSAVTREAYAAFAYRGAGKPKFSVPGQGFIDVPRGHQFYTEIMWMKAKGYTTGVATPQGKAYQPKSPLTREAMAAMIYREAGKPRFTMPKQGFVDVPRSHKFYTEIMWMKAAGLSKGTKNANGTYSYKPKRTADRADMAAFLYRQAGSPSIQQPISAGSVSVTRSSMQVGQNVVGKVSGWTPSGLSYAYSWTRDGKAIPGATRSSYTATPADAGTKLALTVTASKKGLAPVVRSSSAIQVTAPEPEVPAITGTAPKMVGTVQAGSTVTATASGWSVAPEFTWLLNGAVAGTGSSYAIPKDAAGKSLQVRADASAAGAVPLSLASPVAKVAAAPVKGAKPVVAGPVYSDSTVTADVSGWSTPPKVTWYLDDPAYDIVIGSGTSYTVQSFSPGTVFYAVASAGSVRVASDPIVVQPMDDAAAAALIVEGINAHRQTLGLQPLAVQEGLTSGAQQWSQELSSGEYFDHSTAEWRAQFTPNAQPTAENIIRSCTSGGTATPAGFADWAVKNWLASDGHRRNIETASWDATGVGVVTQQFSDGMWCVTGTQIFENLP